MHLSVADVRRIAAAAARAASGTLEVTGVTMTGGSDYSEVLVTIRGCRTQPCQLAVGVFRDVPEANLQEQIVTALRRHLAEHATGE